MPGDERTGARGGVAPVLVRQPVVVLIAEVSQITSDGDPFQLDILEGAVDREQLGFRIPARVVEGPHVPGGIGVKHLLLAHAPKCLDPDLLVPIGVPTHPGQDMTGSRGKERLVAPLTGHPLVGPLELRPAKRSGCLGGHAHDARAQQSRPWAAGQADPADDGGMSEDLADRIHAARFSPVRFKEGYSLGEVDDFLDRLEAAARRGEPLAPLFDGLDLPRVRLQVGYNVAEVDTFLGAIREGRPLPKARKHAPGIFGPLLRRR